MNAKLQAYFASKYTEEKEERDLFLIQLGLFDKAYAPDNEPSDEYYDCEGEGKNARFFKLVPIEVTPEEYARLREYNPKPAPPYRNRVASLLTVLAWIVYAGGFFRDSGNSSMRKAFLSALPPVLRCGFYPSSQVP